MNLVMILAGGTGSRVGADRPKQFVEVLGKPVLAYTTEIFQQNEQIDGILIVCHPDWMDYCKSMLVRYRLTKVRWITPGGETFQASVLRGLERLKALLGTELRGTDAVFIQYGAAPFTSQRIVDAVIAMTREKGSAVTGTPCYQLMATRDSAQESRAGLDRDRMIQIACPYGFRFAYLLELYARAQARGLLDTVEPHTTSLMYALGDVVHYAYGDQTNIKITTQADLELFAAYTCGRRRGSGL